MLKKTLVYTNENCIGCNKCISVCSCPGANVSVENGEKNHIWVDGNKCAACGACFDVCEHHAREFYDDTERFFRDLEKGRKISLLVAPSFKANYPEEYESVLGGLKALGVRHIINVSFGADITTWGYLNYIKNYDFTGGISQPCPAVVGYIERHLPELIPKLFPVQSPLMCAAIYAKKEMGITDRFAFLSPCIAKKMEIDDPKNKGYVSYNVTFDHLMKYVRKHNIQGELSTDEVEYGLGSIYPMPGGLKENVCWFLGEDVFIRQIEGEKHLYHYLEQNKDRIVNDKTSYLFLDALNCRSGCIYGTGCEAEKSEDDSVLENLFHIREMSKKEGKDSAWGRGLSPEERLEKLNEQFSHLRLEDYLREYTNRAVFRQYQYPSEEESDQIFREMKKYTKEERTINCSYCGYDSCKQMVEAIYNGFNKRENCIYYNRKVLEEQKDAAELASHEIEQASQLKSDFLANMSHEIRTPMNAVIGMTEMALREEISPAARDFLHQIKSSGRELLTIINDILDFSKIESGKLEIIPVEYETMSIVNDVVNIIMTRIKEKDVELILNLQTDIPKLLYGDNIRIKQVLINIANNAAKFTNEGRIKISVSCTPKTKDELEMCVSVEDTGIGIKPQDLKKLFVSFQQVDSKRNRSVEGTGLGLAISKNLMKMMGGDVSVESEYEKGSTFSFRFPQRIVDRERSIFVPEPEKKVVFSVIAGVYVREQLIRDCDSLGVEYNDAVSPEVFLKKREADERECFLIIEKPLFTAEWQKLAREEASVKTVLLMEFFDLEHIKEKHLLVMKKPLYALNLATLLRHEELHYGGEDEKNGEFDYIAPEADILVVDDNAVNLTIVEGLLKPLQVKIQTALSGKEAIEKISMHHYDLVFMDHMMPVMDGVETTRIIRRMYKEYDDVPIIALTANAVEGAKDMFLSEGMNDFVSKPIELRTIISKLRQWLPVEKIKRAEPGTIVEEEEADIVIEGLNVQAALELLGSRAVFWSVLETYYKAIEKSASLIEEMEEKEDWARYTIEVHALKSCSKQIGAMELAEMAADLEMAGNARDTAKIRRETAGLLRYYRSYIPILEPFFQKEEEDDSEKTEITAEVLKGFLERMAEAADILDLDTMEEIGDEMKQYRYEKEDKERLERLLEAVESIDTDACCEIMEEWESEL